MRRLCRSDCAGEFGERDGDATMHTGVDTEFVVAAADVLHQGVPRMIVLAVRSRFSPRIARSHACSRPWSSSIRLFAYCSMS